jgi:hypothetical protein
MVDRYRSLAFVAEVTNTFDALEEMTVEALLAQVTFI